MHQPQRLASLPAALAVALALSSPALADDARTLDTITVTAHRDDVPADQALASVTVIGRAQIEASQAPDLLDLLARQAGIDITRPGGPGQSSTVLLRGGNSNHALILIDGMRVNSASQGVYDFAHLPLARIERIEIVRGPRAALWGSDAIGGVIHIFTRDPARARVEARLGSYGRQGLDANAGWGDEDGGLAIGAGLDRLDGFSATNANAFGHDPDDDGYRNASINLRGRARLGSQRLAVSGLATDADVEFDQGETAARNASLSALLAGPLAAGWEHSLGLGHAREDLSTPAYDSDFRSRRNSMDWVFTRPVAGRGSLNLGINASHESARSHSSFSGVLFDRSRDNLAGFIAWRGEAGAHAYELAARHDDSSQFGGAGTGSAAWSWRPAEDWRVRASWGQGFRAPNFNELYYQGFGGLFEGNPDLRPERSRSVELGLDWTPAGNHRLGLSAYRTRVDQLIAFAGVDFQAINIAHAELEGIELSHRWRRGRFSLDSDATWQDARDADTGLKLLRRADRKLQVSAGVAFAGGASLHLDGQGISPRRDFSGDLSGFARFDLRLSLPLAPGWRVEARIENLGDRDYQLADGYNTPGRSGLLRLAWNDAD